MKLEEEGRIEMKPRCPRTIKVLWKLGDDMIIQPNKETRNVNDLFYESEKKRIDMLNREFFHDIELTKKENDGLVMRMG